MVLNMCRRCHLRAEFHHIRRAANVVDGAVAFQLFGYGHDVNRLFVHVERPYGGVYLLVSGFVKGFGMQHLAYHGESVLVYHQGTQHHPFQVESLGRQVSVGVVNGHRFLRFSVRIACFGHVLLCLYRVLSPIVRGVSQSTIWLFATCTSLLRNTGTTRSSVQQACLSLCYIAGRA